MELRKRKRKQLRKYQREMITLIVADDCHKLLDSPTGSGKTLMLIEAARLLVEKGHLVILATTMRSIEDAFVRASDEMDITVLQVRDVDGGSANQLRSIVQSSESSGLVITTHSTFTMAFKEPIQREGRIWILVDEGHHAGCNQMIGVALKQLADNGHVVVLATATAFRSEGTMIELPNVFPIVRTFAQHMEEGFGPASLSSKVVAYIAEEIKDEVFCGKQSPSKDKDVDVLVSQLLSTWLERGRPKVVISIPGSYLSKKIVLALEAGFAKMGVRVLNAYGSGKERADKIRAALSSEEKLSWIDSQIDVIIGCNRVQEGMDWKHCSEVFCVGAPGSASKIIQLAGRAMRMKDETCQERFRNESSIVFFVPTTSGTLDRIPLWHLERILIVCGILEEATSGVLWKILEGINRINGIGKQSTKREYDLFDTARLQINAAFSIALKRLVDKGVSNPTVNRIVSEMRDMNPDMDEESLLIVVALKLSRSTIFRTNLEGEISKWPSKDWFVKLRAMTIELGNESVVCSLWDQPFIREHSIRLGARDIKRLGSGVVRLAGLETEDMGLAEKLSRQSYASRMLVK